MQSVVAVEAGPSAVSSARGPLRIAVIRSITAGVNAWLDTWSAEAARRGEMPSVSRWLGIDVDHFSRPVLATGPHDPRLDARDGLLAARARCTAAILRRAT